MSEVKPRTIMVVGICLMCAMFVAYMIFLVSTWQQLQTDRRAAMSRVDQIMDRMPTVKDDSDKPAAEHNRPDPA